MILTIIVTYNAEKYIEDCIENLQMQTHQTDILVVDNDSIDDTCQIIEKKYPLVKVIEVGYNSGFTHANNIGIQYALEHGYEYVMLINEDTVSDRMLVEKLLEHADYQTAVIPKIYRDGSLSDVWYAAGKIDFKARIAINCQRNQMNQLTEVSFMTGCCMFIHTDILRKVGMFDEKYFMYYEDTDLSLRMYHQGIKMIYVPDTYVWHRMRGKTEKGYYAYYMTRNKLYFLRKHKKIFHCGVWRLVFSELFSIFLKPDIYGKTFQRYKLKGIWDFLRNQMGMMKSIPRRGSNLVEEGYQQLEKYRIFYELTYEWLGGCVKGKSITDWIIKNGYQTVALYGMGPLGEITYRSVKNEENVWVKYGLDQRSDIQIEGLSIYSMDGPLDAVDLIVVTAVSSYEEIRKKLREKINFPCKIISLMQLVEKMHIGYD